MTDDELSELERIEKAASPGPWVFTREGPDPWANWQGIVYSGEAEVLNCGRDESGYSVSGDAPNEADLAFILKAREVFLKLVFEVQAWRAVGKASGISPPPTDEIAEAFMALRKLRASASQATCPTDDSQKAKE